MYLALFYMIYFAKPLKLLSTVTPKCVRRINPRKIVSLNLIGLRFLGFFKKATHLVLLFLGLTLVLKLSLCSLANCSQISIIFCKPVNDGDMIRL